MTSQESKKNTRPRQRRKSHAEVDLTKIHTRIEDYPTFNLSQWKAYSKERKELEKAGIEELFFGHEYEIELLKCEIEDLDSEIEALKDERKMLESQLDSALRDHALKYTEAEDIEMRLTNMIKAIPIFFRHTKPGAYSGEDEHRFRRNVNT